MSISALVLLFASASFPQETPALPAGGELRLKVPPPPNWEDPGRLIRKVERMMKPDEYLKALEETGMRAHLLNEGELLAGGGWQLEGPVGAFDGDNGRVSQIKITPAEGYSVYAGTCAGGLWRWTLNEYQSNGNQVVWRSLGDGLPNPSVRAFDVNPFNEDHILVGTGETQRYQGAGMYVTTDGGDAWAPVTLPASAGTPGWFSKIGFAPSSSQRVLAACSAGLYHSSNGGSTWSRVLSNSCYDFVWDPSNSQRAYAISENGANDTVWRSIDGGSTWTALPVLPSGNFDNGRVAICRDQPGTVVVLTALWNANTPPTDMLISSVVRSTNANTATASNVNWTDISNVTAGGSNDPLDVGGQAFHCLSLAVKPDDANTIIVGAQGQAITTNGGSTWQTQGDGILDFTHADFTSFYFGPFGGEWDDLVWICNDGGMFIDNISGNFSATHMQGDAATGIAISQIDYSDADRDVVGIGLQDNGVVLRDTAAGTWDRVTGGDGTEVTIVDGETGDIWYCNGVYASPRPWRIFREDAGPDTDTNNPDPGVWGLRMFFDVWNSVVYAFAGVNVISIPEGNPSAGWSTAVASPTGDQVRDVWGSLVDGDTLFVTYDGANSRDLSICRKTGSSWNVDTMTGFAPSGGGIETVTPSYRWSDECWVGLSGTGAKVIHVLPDGTTEDITGNLSSLNRVHTIAVTPFNSDLLYVGTDIGVFRTVNGGDSWEPFQWNLPVCQCRELSWVANDNAGTSHKLVIATYGRGVFSRTISSSPLIYVNENATGSQDGSFEHPYQTLSAALSAAPSGATIAVHADTYSEAQTITKNVRVETWAGTTLID